MIKVFIYFLIIYNRNFIHKINYYAIPISRSKNNKNKTCRRNKISA